MFGTAQTINSANYIYFLAQQELFRLDNPAEAFQIFGEEILSLHRGQGMDLFWRDTVTIPTEEEYFQMISDKTGGLFRLGVRLMQSVSSATYEILPLIELMGLIFQIRDDYLNLSSDQVRYNTQRPHFSIFTKSFFPSKSPTIYISSPLDDRRKRLLRRSDRGQILLSRHPFATERRRRERHQ